LLQDHLTVKSKDNESMGSMSCLLQDYLTVKNKDNKSMRGMTNSPKRNGVSSIAKANGRDPSGLNSPLMLALLIDLFSSSLLQGQK